MSHPSNLQETIERERRRLAQVQADEMASRRAQQNRSKLRTILCTILCVVILVGAFMALLTFQADRKVEQYLNKAAIGSASGNITLNSYDQWRAECMVERQIDAYNEGTIEYEAVNEMVSLLLGYTDSEMFTQSLTEKAERLDALCVSKKMFAQGQSYANQGQFLDAVRQYVQVIEFDSNYVEAQRQIKALSDLVDSPEQSDDTPHDASSMNEFERALIMIGLYFAAVAAPILILRYLIKSKFG